jgi:hypothetical protein
MTKIAITRYTCDAPDCEDVVDVEAPPTTPAVQLAPSEQLPDGWIELAVSGASPGGAQQFVHASRPECAAKLAEAQVEQAVEAAKVRAEEEEAQREAAEKTMAEAREAADANEVKAASSEEGEAQG